MDLSKIEGLTEEQQAAITALYNADTEGLRNKNEQLLSEKKSVQASASEKEQALEEARQAAVNAEEEKLVAEGKYKEALELREKENAELTAKANEEAERARSALKERDKTDTLSKALPMFHDSHKVVGETMLSNMLNISYNDQGETITEFKYKGEVVAKSVDELKGWAGEQDTFKQYLNGVDSSGAGADNSGRNASGVNGNDKDAAYKQRLKDAKLI